MKISRDLELEVESVDVTEWLQSQNKTWVDAELLLMERKEKKRKESVFLRLNLLLVKVSEDCWDGNKGFIMLYNLSL